MLTQVEFTDQEIQEFYEFLGQKIQKFQSEIDRLNQTRAKLISDNVSSVRITKKDDFQEEPHSIASIAKSVPETTGWKYKIDDVLKAALLPLPASEIVNKIIRAEPALAKKLSAAKKSVSSVLSTNTKTSSDRYIKVADRGKWVYSLNENYKDGK